jgi:hypothetical protein
MAVPDSFGDAIVAPQWRIGEQRTTLDDVGVGARRVDLTLVAT